jgi:[histone H3]-trimethyl-L-lysine9/36 demethylase
VKPLDKITEKLEIEDIEKLFWKNICFSPPLYGADVPGSVMDQGIPWSLSELKSILSCGLKNVVLSGINDPYLYAGCWKSMFGWHTEDYDLCSINYLHLGKPKFWYSLPEN